MIVLLADAPGYAYGLFGIVILGIALFIGISHLVSSPCARCQRRVRTKSAIRYSETGDAPSAGEPSPSWHDMFAPESSEPLFCSKTCRDLYQDELPTTCAWCKTTFLWKNRVPIEGEPHVFCGLRCRTDYEAAKGVKEDRKRIIREDQ